MALVLYIHAGNSAEWSIPITNADGTAKSLAGASSLTFLVKRRIDDADASAVVTSTPVVTDEPGGVLEVRLTPADTADLDAGTYVWGVQFTDSASKSWEFPDPSQAPGKCIVRPGVVAA